MEFVNWYAGLDGSTCGFRLWNKDCYEGRVVLDTIIRSAGSGAVENSAGLSDAGMEVHVIQHRLMANQ